ncbi:hypothetical protein C3L33_19438, partial [Rhododendron williamsianum]
MDSPLLLMVTKVTWIFLVGFNGLAFVSGSFKLLANATGLAIDSKAADSDAIASRLKFHVRLRFPAKETVAYVKTTTPLQHLPIHFNIHTGMKKDDASAN